MKKFLFLLLACVGSAVPGLSQDKQKRNFSCFLEPGGGASFYLGKHKNATVKPGPSFACWGGLGLNVSPNHSLSLVLGFEDDFQSIRSTSALGSVSYNRELQFLSLGFGYETRPLENKRWKFGAIPVIRVLGSGKLRKADYWQRSQNLSKEELNVDYFRRWAPGLRLTCRNEVFRKEAFWLDVGIELFFSAASLDFQAQPGTLNQIQLSTRFTVCNPL